MNKEYPNYISPKRRPVATPEKIVIDGKAQFGTFDEPFETLNLLDCHKPCGALYPKCLNRKRLTEWEAFEINMDELSLVSAIYNTGSLGFSIMVVYDKAAHKIYSWKNFVSAKAAHVAPQLVNGVSELKTKKSDYKIINDLKNGKARAVGYSENKKFGKFEIDMSVERVSPISNVCIPFGKNKPLYSEKDFFKAVGYISINGKKYESNGNTVSIIDDHKGYYPFIAHYDWLTAMGKLNIGGTEKYFAFNLTRNQSINQDDYNENLIWLENDSSPLPPVKFTRDKKNKNIWYVKDEHGCVDIRFEIDQTFKMPMHFIVIDVKYLLPFGTIYGTLKDVDGNVYTVDGMTGIGEYKKTRM